MSTLQQAVSTRTILVVEDDPDFREPVAVYLEKHNYRVLQAHNGIRAKEMIVGEQPDLVLLDMMMPRLGGFPVLEDFQKKDAPPIIMITANEGNRHKAYAEYLGVTNYLRKPVAMEEILEAVEEVFGTTENPC